MADNWWDSYNEQVAREVNAPVQMSYRYGAPSSFLLSSGPSKKDLDEYRKSTGIDYVDRAPYQNWLSIEKRNRQLSNFVNNMAGQDPTSTVNASRIQGDLANYGQRMNSFLDAKEPVASQENRFSTGLSDAELRLRDLLDNPDSITNSAAYKFRVKQGEEALQRSLGAKGLLNSGNRLMELTKYGQDMGSQEYDAQAGRLSGLLGAYSQAYTGDKNANTQRYLAESQAWNQRGGLLRDLINQANVSANQNQQISSDNRVKWAEIGKGLMPAAPTTVGNTTFWNMVK